MGLGECWEIGSGSWGHEPHRSGCLERWGETPSSRQWFGSWGRGPGGRSPNTAGRDLASCCNPDGESSTLERRSRVRLPCKSSLDRLLDLEEIPCEVHGARKPLDIALDGQSDSQA